MEDETSEELISDSDYSDSFIASDDDLEVELTWDSEDSRPPGPSPRSVSSTGPQNWRSRLRRLRRVHILSDSDSSQVSVEQSELPSPVVTSPTSIEVNVSDSDDTYILSQPNSPLYIPETMPSPDPRQISTTESSQQSLARIEEVYVLDVNLRGPGTPPNEPEVIEIQSSPNRPQAQHGASEPPLSPEPQSLNADALLEFLDLEPQPAAVGVIAPKRAAVEETGAAGMDNSLLSEGDDASMCTICMSPLTNSGSHRVVCLRCGHIFGQSCVERWIKCGLNNGARRCPTCNKKACLKDIRVLYLPKVVPLDTSERDRIQQERDELALQKKMVESDLSRTILQHKLVVERYEKRIQALEERLQGSTGEAAVATLVQGSMMVASTVVSPDGGCRVMAFNCLRQEVVVSQPSGNTVFAGHGVRVINSVDWQSTRFILLHSKMIRDLQFHGDDRDLLLSASLDGSAKLVDLSTTTTVHTFKTENQLPLWSCCWDASNPHLLLLGSQMGKVTQYDRRMMNHYVNMWEMENNRTPVVALASAVPHTNTPFPQGGFLSCRLNAVFTHPRNGEKYGCHELPVEGPFMCMRYDQDSQTMLTTSRPSSRSPYTRVCLNALGSERRGQVCTPVHIFNCGSSAKLLSRAAFYSYEDDLLVAVHNESGRTLDMWNCRSGSRVYSVPIKDPIIDLMPVCLSNNKMPLIAALTEKKLSIYRIN